MKNMKPAVYYVAVRNCRNTPYGIFHKDDLRLTDATVQEKYGPFNRDQAREFIAEILDGDESRLAAGQEWASNKKEEDLRFLPYHYGLFTQVF